jgi:hypothetical protein
VCKGSRCHWLKELQILVKRKIKGWRSSRCGSDIIEGCKVDVNPGRGDMCDLIGEEG